MKVLMFAVIMILSQGAFALDNNNTFSVTSVMDENQQPRPEVAGGLMTIGEDTIAVQLYGNKLCGTPTPEQPVPDCFVPSIVDVQLDIDSFDPSYCGDDYFAEDNKLPVDGAHVVLDVTDYSRILCKKLFPYSATATLTYSYYNKFTRDMITKVYVIEFQKTVNK